MSRRSFFPLMLVFLAVGPARLVSAQEATPAAVFVVPDPAMCTVAPRSVESLLALLATPEAAAPAAPSSGAGEPAVAATVAAVTATVSEVYACLAAGDWQRAAALFTGAALRGFVARGYLTPEPFVEGPGTREAFRVRAARLLADGRVAAVIDFRVSEGVFAETWLFVDQDGRFLVDALPALREEPGTPTP